MMIFHKAKLAYLAVPKTGSTAIEEAFGAHASAIFRDPPGLKHSNAKKFERKIRPLVEPQTSPLETVAIIRDPLEWLFSWFRYRQRPFLNGHPNSTKGLEFPDFVDEYLRQKSAPYARLGSQGRFVTDDAGDLLVTHLFCYDDMGAFMNFMNKRLGTDAHLNRVNVSPDTTTQPQLPNNTLNKFKSKYALDLQLFETVKEAPLTL